MWLLINWLKNGNCYQDFDKAAEDVKTLSKRPSDDELLELYALFKQATVGDVTGGEFSINSIYLYIFNRPFILIPE